MVIKKKAAAKTAPTASESTALTVNLLVAELAKSTHGDLKSYIPVIQRAAKEMPEVLAHLMSYDKLNGQVRDARVALPAISLSVPSFDDAEYLDNSLAHMATLSLRDFVRAIKFTKEIQCVGRGMSVRRLMERYLRSLEGNFAKWERMAIQHRDSLKSLYALAHVAPKALCNDILFKRQYPAGSTFEVIRNLKTMAPMEAAGFIMTRRIPFLIAMGALGPKAKEPDLVLSLINRMSPTELVTNSQMLTKLGIKTVPALRAAYEAALGKAATAKRGANTLKTTVAADAIEDESIKAKLQTLQEKQLDKLGGVDGNWLVLGDMSGSMSNAIETARMVAGALARMVKGKVHLVFFNTVARYFDCTGKTVEEIKQVTRGVTATGGTSFGAGLLCAVEKHVDFDGIAIVSDGAENSLPMFTPNFTALCQSVGKQLPVYLYHVSGTEGVYAEEKFKDNMAYAGHDIQEFDLRKKAIDYYSVVNLASTMSVQRYGLLEKILAVPLLKLDDVLPPVPATVGA
jgi:hypothetical protein